MSCWRWERSIREKTSMIEKVLARTLSVLTSINYMDEVSVIGLLDREVCKASFQYQEGFFILSFRESLNKEIERAVLHESHPFSIKTKLGVLEVQSGQYSAGYSADFDDLSNTLYEIKVNSFKSVDIEEKERFFRFVIPIEKAEWIHHIDTDPYKCEDRLVKGLIDFSYKDEHFHFYPVKAKDKEYLFIDSSQKCTLSCMQDRMFAAVLSVGFFTGYLHMGEAFVLASDSYDFHDNIHIMFQCLRPSVKSICPFFTTNMYSIRACLEMRPELHYALDQLYVNEVFQASLQDWIYEDTMNALFYLLIENQEVNHAVMTMLEVMNMPLDYQGSVFSVLLESLASSLLKKKPKSGITKKSWKRVSKQLVEVLMKSVDENLMPENCLGYMKKRIEGLNYLPNRDKLVAPFHEIGYAPTSDELDVIDLRNTFLHGDIPGDTLEEQREIVLYASSVFQRLCAILVLKTIGFKGYIINNAALLGCKKAVEAQEPVLLYVS